MDDLIVLYTTWPDAETAEAFGRRAVEAKLAACANVLGPMRSIYRWDGRIQGGDETPMLLKTTTAAAVRLRELVVEHHPYQTPCVIAFRTEPALCHPGYVEWAQSETE